MRIQEAIRRMKKLGFNLMKEDDTWYLSKPYSNATCLVEYEGEIFVAYHQKFDQEVYVPFKKAETVELEWAISHLNN